MMKSLLYILFIVKFSTSAEVRIDPLVLTQQGLVRGQRSLEGYYSYFLGIPYAKVNPDNPFGTPLPPPTYEQGIFIANDGTKSCPQMNRSGIVSGDLDCLVLHVYSPNEATSSNPLPVYVYIHGGGFETGRAGGHGIPDLVNYGVVVVSINYRLGLYGFMCLDNPAVPGNQGLKDQYEALQWVKTNIGSFGGDPNDITIGGQSAGSMSVLYQLYANREKLFHKAIAQSGSEQTDGLRVDGDAEVAIKVANHLGLNTSDTDTALNFLKKTSSDLVVGASKDININFLPCKERKFEGIDSFINDYQVFLSNEKNIRNMTILIGNTDAELKMGGGLYNNYIYNKTDVFRYYLQDETFFNLNGDVLDEASNMIKHFYIGDEDLSSEIGSEISQFISDFFFSHPIQRTINNLIDNGAERIYMYLFTDGENGAGHGADLKYLFHDSSNNESLSEEDNILRKRMNTLWANFIKYGNPTPEPTNLLPLTWSSLSTLKRPYLRIDKELKMGSRPLQKRMAFMDVFYRIYGIHNN